MSVNLVNQTDASLAPIAGATIYADEPIGAILPFGGSTVPNGFLLCNGAAVSRTTYAALFAVIGTSFGVGDGSTTFNIPDLRESVPVGAGQNATQTIATHDTYTVGEFKDDQFQSHVHNTRLKGHMTASSGDAWCTSYDQEITGTRTTSASTDTGFTPREGTTTHGKQLGVNYIIKATTISLPSDFSGQVDDMIDAKIVNNLTDGDMRAATSNTVYNCVTVDPTTEDITSCLNTEVATASGVNVTYFHNKQILINFSNLVPKVVGNGKTLLQNLPFNFATPQAVGLLSVDISQSATDTHCTIYTNPYNNWLGAHLSGAGKHYYGQIISVIR